MLRLFRFETQFKTPRSTRAYTRAERGKFISPPLARKEPNWQPYPERRFWWQYWDVNLGHQDAGSSAASTGVDLHGLHKALPPRPCTSTVPGAREAAESEEPAPCSTLGVNQWVRLVVTGNETAEFSLYKTYKFIFFVKIQRARRHLTQNTGKSNHT